MVKFSLQKWSKGKMKEKVNNQVLFDQVRLRHHAWMTAFWTLQVDQNNTQFCGTSAELRCKAHEFGGTTPKKSSVFPVFCLC